MNELTIQEAKKRLIEGLPVFVHVGYWDIWDRLLAIDEHFGFVVVSLTPIAWQSANQGRWIAEINDVIFREYAPGSDDSLFSELPDVVLYQIAMHLGSAQVEVLLKTEYLANPGLDRIHAANMRWMQGNGVRLVKVIETTDRISEETYDGHYDLDGLKYLMDDVMPDEVSDKSEKWCLAKYYLLLGTATAGLFTNQVLEDPGMLYGNYMAKLILRLESFGWKVKLGESPVKE